MTTDYRDRMRAEAEDLDQKIQKITDFILSDGLDSLAIEQQNLLTEQFLHMKRYQAVLRKRIASA